MLAYPVILTADRKKGGFVVTFPDIPEAITQGETIEEALAHAAEALESAMDFYFEDSREVPLPSRVKRGQRVVELPTSVAAKVLLLNEMLKQKISQAELARRLNMLPQEITRMINLKHTTRIDALAGAVKALNRRLDIRIV